MPNYAGLKNKLNELIRRARDGSVFIAPRSADPIVALTTGTPPVLSPLPTGYEDLGWTSTDGVTFGRETESSQIRSFGSVEPTREDIINDTLTMTVTAQETKLLTIGLSTGVDTTGLEAAAVTGELSIAKAALPNPRHYHVLGVFVDETSDGEIYMARYMPNAKITEFGETAYTSDGDDPVQYALTFTGFEASDLGYSHRWIFGGAGWLALLDAMGIDQETP
ncbi:hypothetical protein E1091_01135 [Micromonospora fluostatini]|uniref:Phage tail protein n=1 Tax=Micromonospora fluostatini TaxID=1629071 RepID=A0ABY2DLQ5_9ACTN|nr:hypothetical protein E1091_01135 [Micromonospora fluostatini]